MKAQFKIQKHKTEGATLYVKGDLTVPNSKDFKEYLVKLLGAIGKGTAEISLKEAMAIDVTAIQLMYAALGALKKNARLPARSAGGPDGQGNRFSVQWPDNQAVNDLITKSGFKQALQ